jgi:hypothetical protein
LRDQCIELFFHLVRINGRHFPPILACKGQRIPNNRSMVS